MHKLTMVLALLLAAGNFLTAGEDSGKTVDAFLGKGNLVYSYTDLGEGADILNRTWAVVEKQLPDGDKAEIIKVKDTVVNVLERCGLKGVTAMGNALARDPAGRYTLRGVLHAPAAARRGLLWEMFPGGAAFDPALLPADTQVAFGAQVDFAKIIAFGREMWERYASASDRKKLLKNIETLQREIDADPLALVSTVRGVTAFLAHDGRWQLDNINLRAGAVIATADDALFRTAVKTVRKFAKGLPAGAKVDDGEILIPVEGTPIQVSIRQAGRSLVVTTLPREEMDALLAGKGRSLAESAGFREMAAGLPPAPVTFYLGEKNLTLGRQLAEIGDADVPEEIWTAGERFGLGKPQIASLGVTEAGLFMCCRSSCPLLYLQTHNPSIQNPAMLFGVMAGMLSGPLVKSRAKAQEIQCSNNLKQIGIAQVQWEMTYPDKTLSEGFAGMKELLTSGLLDNPAGFACPLAESPVAESAEAFTDASCGYIFFGGGEFGKTMKSHYPVAFDKPGNHPGRACVLYKDCHVAACPVTYGSCREFIDALQAAGSHYDEADLKILRERAAVMDRMYGLEEK